jgi:type II secretory pathway pseudopilin PulG
MASHTPTGRPVSGQSGFTLLALLFLVAGLGVGMAALGVVWHTASQREKEKELLFVGSQYRQAIESFWNRSPGEAKRLPKNFDELLADPRFPNTVRHLRRVYRDPMAPNAEWGLLKEADGGISGVYSLSEARPFKRADFAGGVESFQEAASYRDWVFRFDHEAAAKDAEARKKAAAGQAAAQGASSAPSSAKPEQ